MENIITMQGYHTCKTEGGWSYIRKNAPFLSEPNNRQWLTQGYYFWTDSDYFAHQWGRQSIRGKYAIVECSIEIERNLLLDLVGSVSDQLVFKELLDEFSQYLKEQDTRAKPTVHAMLKYYRKLAIVNKGIFPYIAIKAQDRKTIHNINFIKGNKDLLPLITRQQLCLFNSATHCIKNKNIIYPKQF